MKTVVRHRRWLLGLVILALLWAALAPTLARAWAGESRTAERIQICTSTGMAWVTPEAAVDADPNDGAADAIVCEWCLLHGGSGWAPSELRVGLPPSVDSALPDPQTGHAAVPPLIWWRPQPHAPPLLSV
ncbi:MAG: DUF2946 family protein [Tepidimonas sp.]|uniref:DUF2946 family protein n=1 Tax=Tepidimonas sp. TaxID=2002775 RepID=UPI00259FBA86|nr:DUF2946 family protein [Tepidimonas sp.]MDM7456283.1 DUF2946 family protein [Tepidimonas sp.]